MPRVGEIFREEREQKGLTLRNIEELTSIRLRYLEAIEAGDDKVLPGEVYAKGFVRNYAIALGLDGTQFVNMYKAELESVQNVQNKKLKANDEIMPLSPDISQVKEDFYKDVPQAKNFDSSRRPSHKPKLKLAPLLIFLTVFICAVLIGVYIVLTFFYNTKSQEILQENINKQPIQTIQQTENNNLPESISHKQESSSNEDFRILNDGKGRINIVPSNNTQINQIEMQAEFTGNCWTHVVADGVQVFSGVLRYGSQQNWQAKENLYVKIGNVGAVTLTLNGKKLEHIADTAPVAEATITILK